MATLYAIDSATNIIYGINSLTGTARSLGELGLHSESSGLSLETSSSPTENVLYASNLSDSINTESFAAVDLSSGNATIIGSQLVSDLDAIAQNDGITYGFSASQGLGTINLNTGEFAPSFENSTLPVAIKGADFDESSNTLFAIGEDNALYTIDVNTGEASLIGVTEVDFNSQVGLAYSEEEGRLYALGNDSDTGNSLYQIDSSTGLANLVGNTGLEEVSALELVPDGSIPSETVFAEPEDDISREIIVRVNPNMSSAAMTSMLETIDAELVETTQSLDIQLIEVEGDIDEAVEILNSNPNIEYAEPNSIVSIAETIPNDPAYNELYGLNNTGQTGGIPDADIDSPEAWDIQTGSSDVVIGVIDTGVDYTHPDLDDNMWTNSGEIPDNGVDDDGNGFVDDFYGYDFVNDDGDPFDQNGHGTHVSGTIAAEGNNGVGVTGTSWDGQIMALQFLDSNGFGTTFGAIQAIDYAILMGADLTNNSWGGTELSLLLEEAIAAAGDADQLFVAAAGNQTSNTDIFPHYPSSYDLENIISVAATNDSDNLAGFSNFGAETVDLSAPGVNILSTVPGNGYAFSSGTSMASPHVAGVVSLLLAQDPSLTAEEIKQIILSNVDLVADLEGITVTGGRLNAFNSLQAVDTEPLELIGTPNNDIISGTNQREVIYGLEGDDLLEGRGGSDEIFGGEGNDNIDGGDGNDTLLGEDGNDLLDGSSGDDSLNGGIDSDTLIGGSDNDILEGDAGEDTLIGVELSDSDSEFGGGEIDTLAGGEDADSFILGDSLRVYYEDGSPLSTGQSDYAVLSDVDLTQDSIVLAGTADLYRLDLFTSESGTIDAALIFDSGTDARRETIAILQNVPANLTIEASVFQFVDSAVIPGDIAESGFAEDAITSEEIDEFITGEEKNLENIELVVSELPIEPLAIDEPNDTIGEAIDTGITFDNPVTYDDSGFIGDNFNVNPADDVDLLELELNVGDRLTVDIDAQDIGSNLDPILRLFDSAGNEVAVNDDSGSLDSFIEFTAPGSDTYYVGVSSYANFSYDPFIEESGNGGSTGEYNLEIAVDPQIVIIGTEGDDVLTGTADSDVINGLGGNDIIEGLAENDTISGGDDADLVTAGTGDDSVSGDLGPDRLLGGDGNDAIDGGQGRDRLLGESGDDTVTGGNGNDTVIGGTDNDELFGGRGEDLIFGGSGNDTLDGNDDDDSLEGGSGNDSLDGGQGNDRLVGVNATNSGDELTGFGTGEIDIITGGAGNNTIILADADRIFYDDGNPLTGGESDLAFITDLDPDSDTVVLQGSSDLYRLDFYTAESGTINADLLYDPGVSAREELIASLEDVDSDLSMTDSVFNYV